MGMDFFLYVIKNEGKEKYSVEELVYLANARADIIGNWLCTNHSGQITHYNNIYTECFMSTLEELYEHLTLVLNQEDAIKRDYYAMFYLPPRLKVGSWCSGSEMFSESYYMDLERIKLGLEKIVNNDSFDDSTVFMYHIEV